MEHFDVGVVGTGYVGLATGASLAYEGHRVTCLDNNQERVASLREGKVPFYEPGLQELIAKSAGRLRFASSERLTEVIRGSDVLIVAVGTPQGGHGSADLSNVANVARAIGRALGGSTPRELPLVVVNESTVPIGGACYVSTLVDEGIDEAGGKGAEFRVGSNPEVLREGSAVHDSPFPDRVVVGTDSREALDVLRTLYSPIVEQSFPTAWDPRPKVAVPFVTTDLGSAEMIKYPSNAFLATKISFINEVSNLCELVGADISDVAYGLDDRVGSRFLSAGLGWGGPCFPKDVAALMATAREYETPLLAAAAARLAPNIHAVFDPYEALRGAHAAVVVTEWEEVRGLDPKKAASPMRDPKLIVDGRNALDAAASREAGLLYRGFGRGYDSG
jgi:UDPglucose 6-dehydrogenase